MSTGMDTGFRPTGYAESMDIALDINPKIFLRSLQHRGVVPFLPKTDPEEEAVLCIAHDCYDYATQYALYIGTFKAFDGDTNFGIAPICDHHNQSDIDMEAARRWTKNNVTLGMK